MVRTLADLGRWCRARRRQTRLNALWMGTFGPAEGDVRGAKAWSAAPIVEGPPHTTGGICVRGGEQSEVDTDLDAEQHKAIHPLGF